jgi:hypothetical protein
MALSASDVAELTAEQLPALTAVQLSLLSAGQLAALSKAQVAFLSIPALSGLSAMQIALLKPIQVSGFTPEQVAALTPMQLAIIKPAQLASLPAIEMAAPSAIPAKALTKAELEVLADQMKVKVRPGPQPVPPPQPIPLVPAVQPAPQPVPLPQPIPVVPAVQPAPTNTQNSAPAPAEVIPLSTKSLAAMAASEIAGLSADQINALTPAQLASLKINYNTMLSILQSDAVGGITADEFSSLKALVGKFNVSGGIAVSGYLEQISENVVLGNVANATWTGGAAHSTPLGNMTATSSEVQADELIGKWFLGTDLPGSRVNMNGAPNFTITNVPVSKPLFGVGGPTMLDINQGYLGDCFLLAPLAAMALEDPSAVRSMITDNGNNTWGVRFIVDGKVTYVTVDNELANGGSKFTGGPNDWGGLVEKAYAQLQASGNTTGNDFTYGNSYSSIANGGSPAAAMAELTGAATITQFAASGSSWTGYVLDGTSLTRKDNHGKGTVMSSSDGMSTQTVQEMLVADLAAGDEVVLSSYTTELDATGEITLVANHAMTVSGFDAVTGMFEIYNTWGTRSDGGQDWNTTFEVSLGTLMTNGDVVSVASKTAPTPLSGSAAPLLAGAPQQFGTALGLAAAFA